MSRQGGTLWRIETDNLQQRYESPDKAPIGIIP
jgi:hypothetical protein